MRRFRITWPLLAVLTLGISPNLGCDDELQLAVENGVIASSTSLLGAIARAVIELGLESTDPNS